MGLCATFELQFKPPYKCLSKHVLKLFFLLENHFPGFIMIFSFYVQSNAYFLGVNCKQRTHVIPSLLE